MKMNCLIHALTLTLMSIGGAQAQSPSGSAVPVTVDNFVRAESDVVYFDGVVQLGAFGKFYHFRELFPVDRQGFLRPNRDTLYSLAVFDLDAGPVTISLPDAGTCYMSMQVYDEDQFTKVQYMARAATPSQGRIFLRGTSGPLCVFSLIRQTRKISKKSTPCRMRSK